MRSIHYYFAIFWPLLYGSGVVAQTTPELIFPQSIDDAIRLYVDTNTTEPVPDQDVLAVFVENEGQEYIANAIQGQYTRVSNYLHFKPHYPFEKGLSYMAKVKRLDADGHFYQSFQVGKKEAVAEAKVVEVYPSANQLPENLLRFYIYFNTPMRKGQALEHIKLINSDDTIDSSAFMEFKQELWSSDGKRLTILFDPGRIKRGVSTNILRGPALLENKQYRLSISGDWQDVHGQYLSEATKEIEVVTALRQSIRVDEWSLRKPKANTLDTLAIHFDRIMDHALLQSMIQLTDEDKNLVAGYWEISKGERLIKFIPAMAWEKKRYQVIVDSRLEDVAGNNLHNSLDHHKTAKANIQPSQFIEFRL